MIYDLIICKKEHVSTFWNIDYLWENFTWMSFIGFTWNQILSIFKNPYDSILNV